jgi:uncharacterized protein (TIGR02246 family)
MRFTMWLMVAALLATACGGTTQEEPAATAPPDPAPINELRNQYMTAYNAGDAAGVAALFTDDAVSMPDHHTAISGKAAIQQFMQEMFTQYTANLTVTPGDTEISGDIAHEHGTFTGTITPKTGGGAPMMQSGNYLVVLKRQPDGSWRIHHDIDNSSAPHPGMTPPGQTTTQR